MEGNCSGLCQRIYFKEMGHPTIILFQESRPRNLKSKSRPPEYIAEIVGTNLQRGAGIVQ
jgi:hypothetical protein